MPDKLKHVLWVNEAADFVGGCEQYIYNTVRLLRNEGVRSTLLFDCRKPHFSTAFAELFDRVFPLVDEKAQVAAIAPDLVYVHRLADQETVRRMQPSNVPIVRFFHDYQLFCPREHRYTTIGRRTCRKPIGMRCYVPCLGVINRTDHGPGLRLNPVRKLRKGIQANRDVDACVVGSQYMADLVAAHGFDAERLHVVPLYALPATRPSGHPRDPELLLFAGQLIRSKGVDTLLQAMARVSCPYRLVIAGQGRQEDLFRCMAKDLGLEDRVTFLGRVPHDELEDWYSKALGVVVPSRYPETFGLIGPEAMRFGTALIGTDVGAIGEWLEDDVTGYLVPPNDPVSLSQAVERLLADPERAGEMGQAGRRRYEELFTPELHVKALLTLFQNVVEGSGRRG